MKKVYLLLTVALLSSVLVNAQLARITKNDVKKNQTRTSTVARRSTPSQHQTQTPSSALIWSDDFSNPSNWSTTHAAGTSGDWIIGSSGPNGGFPIDPIATAGDFGLFDSDYLCTHDQIGDLTTANPIDLTGHPNVKLSFNEYYERFHDSTYIYVSTNGTSWTRFEVNAGLQSNFFPGGTAAYTPPNNGNPWPVTVDISSVAGNQATVWIRFEFYSPDTNGAGPDTMTISGVPGSTAAGCGYAWMVDDVTISDIAATDARLMPADIGEYVIFPIIQPEAIQLRGRLINSGTTVINGGQIIFNMYDGNGQVSSDTSSASGTLNPGDTSTYLTATNTYIPPATGFYLMEQLVYVSGDGDAINDTTLFDFFVSDSTYARDAASLPGGGNLTAAYGFNNASGALGQIYEIWNASYFTSANAFLTSDGDSLLGEDISFEVWTVVGGVPDAVIGTTGHYTLTAADTAARWVTVPFTAPVNVAPGNYCIVINQYGTRNIGVGFSPNVYTAQKTFYNPASQPGWNVFPDQDGVFLLQVNNAPLSLSAPTLGNKLQISLFPNPSSGYVYIKGNADKNVTVEVTNSVGQLVKSVKFETLTLNHLDLRNSPSGMYNVRITTEAGSVVKTIMIE
jgi:hypothetical protein